MQREQVRLHFLLRSEAAWHILIETPLPLIGFGCTEKSGSVVNDEASKCFCQAIAGSPPGIEVHVGGPGVRLGESRGTPANVRDPFRCQAPTPTMTSPRHLNDDDRGTV